MNKDTIGYMQTWFKNPEIFFLSSVQAGNKDEAKKIIWHKDRIVVLQLREVFIYDTLGNHLATINANIQKVKYPYWGDMTLDKVKEEFILYGVLVNQFFIYDLNGKFKRKVVLPKVDYERIEAKDKYIYALSYSQDSLLKLIGLKFNGGQVIKECHVSYPLTKPMSDDGFLVNDEFLNIILKSDCTVYSYCQNKIIPRYRFHFNKHNLSKYSVDAHLLEASVKEEHDKHYSGYTLYNLTEINKYFFFSVNYSGICIIDKEKERGNYYSFLIDKYIGISYTASAMRTISTLKNDYICFNIKVKGIKKILENQRLPSFVNKEKLEKIVLMSKNEYDDVLFFYQSMK